MSKLAFLLVAAAAICFTVSAPQTQAQVAVEVGPAPVCPYGYYDVPPYNCAPYGYYGPEWFSGGVFIGVGPWFHGPEGLATSIIISIPTTDTTAHTQPAASTPSGPSTIWSTSTATKCATATATP
jgi:hypothetical protein